SPRALYTKGGTAERDGQANDPGTYGQTTTLSTVPPVLLQDKRLPHRLRLFSSYGRCSTVPRHAPVSLPRSSINFLNRWRSPRTRAVTTPSISPRFSTMPSGS